MIIHEPELIKRDNHTIIYSKIELLHPPANFPEYLWYKVPDNYSKYLSPQSDAFLIPGLLAGMHFQEDIEVRGTVSPRLAYNLAEYMHLLNFRMPKFLAPVEIKYSQLKPLQAKPAAVATTFSGGVDAFFTIWKHLPQNQIIPSYQITHALFILGFDILNKEKNNYDSLFSRFHAALSEINVELIPLETNLFTLIAPRLKMNLFYGPVLIGPTHVLGCLFNKVLIPSSNDYQQIQKWTSSSDPTSDPLLSTEKLEIIHYGANYRRVHKIEAISNWKPAQTQLRVCTTVGLKPDVINCSRCEKCVRTMIPIYAMGNMEKFTTFHKPLMSNRDILWWARKFDPSTYFVKESSGGFLSETFSFIRQHKPSLVLWLRLAIFFGTIRFWVIKLIPKLFRNRLQRYGYFFDPLIQDNAYENLDVIDFIKTSNTTTK
jgi:hypothetical protein